jgi:hypothetical protein
MGEGRGEGSFSKPKQAPPRPAPISPPPQTLHPSCSALSIWRPHPAPIPRSSRAGCSSRVIHLVAVRKDSGSDPVAASAADAGDVTSDELQVTGKLATRHPSLVTRHFPGRKPLQPDVRETHRGHRPAQFHRATRGNRQRCKPPNGFQPSQIIRRIHLHHQIDNYKT